MRRGGAAAPIDARAAADVAVYGAAQRGARAAVRPRRAAFLRGRSSGCAAPSASSRVLRRGAATFRRHYFAHQ